MTHGADVAFGTRPGLGLIAGGATASDGVAAGMTGDAALVSPGDGEVVSVDEDVSVGVGVGLGLAGGGGGAVVEALGFGEDGLHDGAELGCDPVPRAD